jgi:molybdate transport system substrate-binding protein
MKGKTKLNALVRVPEVVAAGEVELAIAGVPTLLSVKGVQVVGLLPAELQSWFVNTAGVNSAAKQPDAAKALLKHLATPEAATAIKAKGMEPLGK